MAVIKEFTIIAEIVKLPLDFSLWLVSQFIDPWFCVRNCTRCLKSHKKQDSHNSCLHGA
jgi:hypothetical protein